MKISSVNAIGYHTTQGCNILKVKIVESTEKNISVN